MLPPSRRYLPALPSGLTLRLSHFVDKIDDNGTAIFVALYGGTVVISVLISGLVYPTSNFEASILFRSIYNEGQVDHDVVDQVRTVCVACVCLGLVHLLSGVADVVIKKEWVAKRLIFRLGFICSIIMVRIPILVITASPSNPLGVARLGVKGVAALCKVISFIWQFEAVFVSLATMVFVVGKDSRFLRPSLVLPLAAAWAASSIMKQLLDAQEHPPVSLMYAFTLHMYCAFGVLILAVLFVVERMARIPALRWAARKVWPAHAFSTSNAGSTAHDVDSLIAILSVCVLNFSSHGWLLFVNRGQLKRARDLDISFFIYFETIPSCAFLILMIVNSANITSRHVEQQRRERESMRALDVDRNRILSVLTSIVPPRIADLLIKGQEVRAERHEFAVIFFSGG